ncbi:MAG: 3-phosphoserine/phosphohydroxythreonine aminotransferase, partial [Euryarchaeota archaeon]|nr:3-phosphoserine/phosphohydroxythreonine aminotransferase [Euryarchaeota archaeon]
FWTPHAEQGSRSIMNATFRIADESLLGRFIAEAEELGLKGLRGHRIVGGIRASMYNGLELGSVERLVGFMRDFENRHS